MAKTRLGNIAGKAGTAALLLFAGAVLAGGFYGVLRDGKAVKWSAQTSCKDGCPRGFYSAEYEILRCSYVGFMGERYLKFLIAGWQGDTDVASQATSSGQQFPPPLPPYRKLNEAEIEKVRAGRAASEVCPRVYDRHYGTAEALEVTGLTPVAGG